MILWAQYFADFLDSKVKLFTALKLISIIHYG